MLKASLNSVVKSIKCKFKQKQDYTLQLLFAKTTTLFIIGKSSGEWRSRILGSWVSGNCLECSIATEKQSSTAGPLLKRASGFNSGTGVVALSKCNFQRHLISLSLFAFLQQEIKPGAELFLSISSKMVLSSTWLEKVQDYECNHSIALETGGFWQQKYGNSAL